MGNIKERIPNFIEKTVLFLEKERLNFIMIFLWIILLGGIRMIIESNLFGYPYKNLGYSHIFSIAHVFFGFYICVFLGGVFILKVLTEEKVGKIANLASWGFIMVIMPPIIDHFIFGYRGPYKYIPPEKFFDFVLFSYHKIFPYIAGYGLLIEILFIVILTTTYTYIKTKSIPKAVINFISFNFFIAFVSTPALNPLLNKWEIGDLCQPAFFLRYVILSIFIFLLIMLVSKKGLLSSFIISSGPLRSLHFLIMGLVGIFIADQIKINTGELTSYTNSGNIGIVGITLFVILFVWQYATMINNVYDVEIDKITKKGRVLVKGFLSPNQLREISIIFAISAVGMAFTLGVIEVILTLLFIFLATIYSVPPFRLRNSPFSTTIIGLGSSIAFFIGYFAPSYELVNGEVVKSYPAVTTSAMIIGWIIFISLSAGSMVKDIDDYEGDKKTGVKNIFTLYGIEKGINISASMLILSFLSPLLLFHEPIDIVVFMVSAALTIISFVRIKKAFIAFPFYFIVLLYSLLRWFGIFTP